MARTNSTVHVLDACESRSIVTDATGFMRHWIMCLEHEVCVLCEEVTCVICRRLGLIHGDQTDKTAF
mgnify:CR=1 FL=1